MALSGSQKAYLQARSGIARSGAIRSNYVFPLFAVVTVNGLDLTESIRYGSLRVTLALNEQPDTAAFEVMLTDSTVQANLVVGADVLIGLGGATENPIFGGRILTTQTTRGPARSPSVRSVLCADYLQVLDSEYLITYDWPAQSATVTIQDLIARFANKPGGVAISTAGVAAGLPSHASIAIVNERFSTVLRRLVTMFAAGGGYYVDPLKVLHVWQGDSEPGLVNPSPLTLENPLLKAFSETVDGAQVRDAVVVEGRRTTAPIGTPGFDPADPSEGGAFSVPVIDAGILDPIQLVNNPMREVRIGSQRFAIAYADGVWSAPAGTPQVTTVLTDVGFSPGAGGDVLIPVVSLAPLTNRNIPWVKIDDQYLRVIGLELGGEPPYFPAAPFNLRVPRTGYGCQTAPIKAEAAVINVDAFSAMYVTDRYNAPGLREKVRAQPIGSDVVLTVRSATGTALYEQLVQDGRFSRSGATARGVQEWTDFRQALIAIDFETEDVNAKPGRMQAYSLSEPPITPMIGEYMILTASLSWPVWGLAPRRLCHAAEVQAAAIVDTWVTDPR